MGDWRWQADAGVQNPRLPLLPHRSPQAAFADKRKGHRTKKRANIVANLPAQVSEFLVDPLQRHYVWLVWMGISSEGCERRMGFSGNCVVGRKREVSGVVFLSSSSEAG